MALPTVDIADIPHEHGLPLGRYRLRYSGLNATTPGAQFVDGVTQEPVTGRYVQRLRMAFGTDCTIEPWDEDTLIAIAAHLESIGKKQRAAALLQSLEPEPDSICERCGRALTLDEVEPACDACGLDGCCADCMAEHTCEPEASAAGVNDASSAAAGDAAALAPGDATTILQKEEPGAGAEGGAQPSVPAPGSPTSDRPASAPQSEPEIVGGDLDELAAITDMNALRSIAEGAGVKVDHRWGRPRLIDEIRKQRVLNAGTA